jgi:hypothetical protein
MAPISSTLTCTGRRRTADLIGREMDFECRCGRRWRLEHYWGKVQLPKASAYPRSSRSSILD